MAGRALPEEAVLDPMPVGDLDDVRGVEEATEALHISMFGVPV
ncbi:hypothetical protein [Amycolatopsis coloradensis]|nr:hypothetical protein [Amycolatopsis coloradensis]